MLPSAVTRDIPRYVAAAVLTLLFAALVVAVGTHPAVVPSLYFPLVGVGALLTLGGVAYHPAFDWELVFSLWPPWVLALVVEPSSALAIGFLAGGVGGLLVVPVLLLMERRETTAG